MRNTLFLIPFLFLLWFPRDIYSQQNFTFEHVGVGYLPDLFYCCNMMQDKIGLFWIADKQSLIKYDGYNFTIFRLNDIDSNAVVINPYPFRYVFIDNENDIWLLTSYGLSMYQRDKNKFINYYLYSEGDWYYSYHTIEQDKNGLLWLTSNKNGLISFNKITNEAKFFKHNELNSNSLSTDSLLGMVIDDYNNLWISTFKNGLIKYDIDNDKFSNYNRNNENNSIASNYTKKIYKDRTGEIWIGLDSNRFDEFDPVNNQIKHYRLSVSSDMTSFYMDQSGILWIAGDQKSGIILFDKATNTCQMLSSTSTYLTDFYFHCRIINEDRSGTIWISAINNGLFRINKFNQSFKLYKNENNPSFITALCGDNLSNLWIGTRDGLDKLNLQSGKYTHYESDKNNPNSLSGNDINSLYYDKSGILWICAKSGLTKFDAKENIFTQYVKNKNDSNSIINTSVSTIIEDRYGELWISGSRIEKFNRQTGIFKHYLPLYDDSGWTWGNFTSILEDRYGVIWLSSGNAGLLRFDRSSDSFTKFYNRQSFALFSSIFEDTQNRFWLTSYFKGLFLFDRDKFTVKVFGKSSGLLSDFTYNVLEDNFGKLWLNTRHGLSRFDPENETFVNYTTEDSLPVIDFGKNAVYKSKDGTLYFGGAGGVISFNPKNIFNNSIPNVILTDFKLFNNSVSPSDNSPLKENINSAKEINLSYNINSFSFEFAALDFNNPKKNQYAYMMEGFDKDWIKSGNVRTANYTNLDPGEYTFRVKGSNNDGLWNEKGTSIKVIITPPWWRTWWFRGCGVILILGILGYTRQRQISKIRREIKQKEEFARQLIDSQEQERKRIAGDLHDSLAQNLLVTKNRVSLLERKKNIDNEIKSELIGINEGILGSLSEIRTISYSLRPHDIERFGLTDSIRQLIEKIKESGGIDFKIQLDNIDKLLKQGDEVILYRIIQECLNNILKHSAAKTSEIHISKLPETIQIIIKDDGKGFDIEIITDQAKGNFGLKGLKERVNLLKGTFNIITSAKKGTIIQINIPAKENSY